MTHDPRAVANLFLDLAESEGEVLSPMKIQKLVYLAHGWYLALCGEPLLNEDVQAWTYGPVVPSVYHAFKHYGSRAITAPASTLEPTNGGRGALHVYALKPDEFVAGLVRRVWEVYRTFSPVQLSNLSHEDGSPWDRVWNSPERIKERGVHIPDEVIADHFRHLAGTQANAGAE